MSANSTAVVLSTLHGTTPALGVAVAGRESRDGLAVDLNGLGVVAAGIVELVWRDISVMNQEKNCPRSLTVHGDLVTLGTIFLAITVDGHLAVVYTDTRVSNLSLLIMHLLRAGYSPPVFIKV